MNAIFVDLVAQGKVAVYLDDILIFTVTLEEHREIVKEVLRRLQEHDLYLRPEKCEFEREEVEYLGMIIHHGEVRMDPAKVKAVAEWPDPRNLKELRGFVGFANFYRRFIWDFSTKARPLHDLTKKDVPWAWGPAQKEAFEALKRAFTEGPVLAHWDPDREMRVEIDASGFATGGVISQKGNDGIYHPIAFRSESMTAAERNYEIHDWEMLGIIRALEEWRHWLEGLPKSFEIVTDHKNLQYWTDARNLTRRQARWAIWLSRFDFRLLHKAGKSNVLADALSRLGDKEIGDSEDNQKVTVLKPEHFERLAATVTADTDDLESRIRSASERDSEVLTGLKSLKDNGLRKLLEGGFEWEEEDGLVYHQGKLYVPRDTNLRRNVVKSYHDSLGAGHPGINNTIELVSRRYWWPGLSLFVRKYVLGCEDCVRRKAEVHPPSGSRPVQVPAGPWDVVGVDLITGLPTSKGYDAICTYVDLYTKQAHFIPTHETVDTAGIADLHIREVYRLHGLPSEFVSDRGPQFASCLMRLLYSKLGIKASTTTAYHLEANGQTERMNKEVAQYLRLFCSQRQDDWANLLPLAEFAINNRQSGTTGYSPFWLMHGYNPWALPAVGRETAMPEATSRLSLLSEARAEAESALRMAKERLSQAPCVKFQIGDKVWLDTKNIRIRQPSGKLGPKKLGPFEVTKVIGDRDYQLALPRDLKVYPVFHVDRLSPWKGNDVNGILPPPPQPVQVQGEEEYEVESILDSRIKKVGRGQCLEYLVHWKGYSAGKRSWEPSANLTHARAKVTAFHRQNPSAPQAIRASVFFSIPWRPLENATEAPPPLGVWEEGRFAGIPSRTMGI